MNLKGIKVLEGRGGGEQVKRWGLAVGAEGLAVGAGWVKKRSPGGSVDSSGLSDRGRLPTLPLSQYHRRGGV